MYTYIYVLISLLNVAVKATSATERHCILGGGGGGGEGASKLGIKTCFFKKRVFSLFLLFCNMWNKYMYL